MKKIIIVGFAFFVLGNRLQAQTDLLGKATSAAKLASNSGFNVKSLTKTIVNDNLTPKLGLSSTQIPGVTSAVSSFLTNKEKILPLLQTNKTAYATQQNQLFSNLKTQLAKTLLKQQMSKFLGLQSSSTAGSALSYLFK